MKAGLGSSSGKGELKNIPNPDNVVISLGNPSEKQNIISMYAKQAYRSGKKVIVIDPRETEMTRYASSWIRIHPEKVSKLFKSVSKLIIDKASESKETVNYKNLDHMIAELINYDSLKISKELEISDEDIKNLSEILSTGSTSFIFGHDMLSENELVSDYVSSLMNLILLTGNINDSSSSFFPLIEGANQIGALHIGANNYFNSISEIENSENDVKEENGLCIIFEDGLSFDEIIKKSKKYKNKIIFTNKKEFLNQGFDLIIPSSDFSTRNGTYVNIENRVQLSNNPVEIKSGLNEAWEIISNISKKFDGIDLDFNNFESIFRKMCSDIKTFNNLNLESLANESFLLEQNFNPQFNFITEKNLLNNDSVRLYKGRVLIKENDVVNIEKDGDSNIVKENIIFNVSNDILKKYNLKVGENITLRYGTEKTEVSGKVVSELNLSNTLSITSLFGEMAREMQNSENKDWSMDIPILDYEIVNLK